MNDISVHCMTVGDLPAADGLRRLAGWNQLPEDWRRLLRLEPHGCFLAKREGEVVGTVTTTTYGQALAWIGMMLVHPDRRRQGIGRRLMQQALDYLQARPSDHQPSTINHQLTCIRLDATPAGYPLYEKLGFVPEWTLTRWQRAENSKTADGERRTVNGKDADVRELRDADWPAVDNIDTAAFGAPRGSLLRGFAQHSRIALVWPAEGRVLGWGLLRPGAKADYLGPLTCSSTEGSLSLVAALLRGAGERSVFWDVPDQNEPANAAAQRFGFTTVRPLTRMRLGPNTVPTDPLAQFAIADPAVG